jgi:hypothetical protein
MAQKKVETYRDEVASAREWKTRAGDHQKTSEDIEHDIERTRVTMDKTMDEIGNRLHPRHLLNDVLDAFRGDGRSSDATRQRMRETGARILDTVQRNPLPTFLIGAGVGWLLYNEQNKGRPQIAGTGPDAGEQAGRTGAGLREKAGDIAGNIQQKADELRRKSQQSAESGQSAFSDTAGKAQDTAAQVSMRAREMTEQAKERAAEMRGRVQETYSRTGSQMQTAMEKYPLAFGIASLAAGVFAGIIFPQSEEEENVFSEQTEKAEAEIKPKLEEAAEKAKEKVSNIAETAKEKAQKQGLTVEKKPDQPSSDEDIAEKSKKVINDTADEAKDEFKKAA